MVYLTEGLHFVTGVERIAFDTKSGTLLTTVTSDGGQALVSMQMPAYRLCRVEGDCVHMAGPVTLYAKAELYL